MLDTRHPFFRRHSLCRASTCRFVVTRVNYAEDGGVLPLFVARYCTISELYLVAKSRYPPYKITVSRSSSVAVADREKFTGSAIPVVFRTFSREIISH